MKTIIQTTATGKTYATADNAEKAAEKLLEMFKFAHNTTGEVRCFITACGARLAPVFHVRGDATQYVHMIASAGFYVFN